MKHMKKLLCLGLACAMSLTLLSACGAKKVKLQILDTAYTTEDYAIGIAKENTDLLGKVDGALAELKADGTVQAIVDKYISGTANDLKFQQDVEGKPELVMSTNAEFPPYEYYDGETIVGIDAEIAAAIADKLGMKLTISDMKFDAAIVAAQTGKSDIVMAGLTVTDERKESLNFTESYATGVQVVIVPEGSKITSVDDLFAEGANHIVGVQTGTTGDIYTTGDIEEAGLGSIQRFNKGADAVQALLAGKIDCVVIDNEPAKSFVASNNG